MRPRPLFRTIGNKLPGPVRVIALWQIGGQGPVWRMNATRSYVLTVSLKEGKTCDLSPLMKRIGLAKARLGNGQLSRSLSAADLLEESCGQEC